MVRVAGSNPARPIPFFKQKVYKVKKRKYSKKGKRGCDKRMLLEFVRGIFSMANAFIAFFIVIYAFLFLHKTKSHKERRPWDYLVIASIIYLAYTLLSMLFSIYGVNTILSFHVSEMSTFFQFVYSGLILLSFISQTDLIFKNELIIITRKLGRHERDHLDVKIVKKEEKKKKKKEKKEEG